MKLFEKLFVYTVTFIGVASAAALVLSMFMLAITGDTQ